MQLKKKWIGNEQVDGLKILLENTQSIRSKDSLGNIVELLKMRATDVIEMLKAPEVMAEGLSQSSLATIRQVEEKIAQLVDASPAALDTLKELAEALGNDENFAATIATQLGQLNTDIEAVELALSNETAARIAADQDLQDQITALGEGSSGLTQEIQDRIAGDEALGVRIDEVETEMEGLAQSVSDLETSVETDIAAVELLISNEATTRGNADTALQNSINDEITNRTVADTALQNSIIDLQTQDGVLQAAIAAEVSDRQGADNQIIGLLTDETNQRVAADEAIGLEIDALEAADIVLQNNISSEESARIAADAILENQISALGSNLKWRDPVFLVTEDAELKTATEGQLLSEILPMGDDDLPLIPTEEFQAGQYLVSRDGVNSKISRLYLDGSDLKVTYINVAPLVAGHSFVVKYDLPDAPNAREGVAFYHFDGVNVFKLADIDFALANSINLSPDFVSNNAGDMNTVLVGDAVELAIAKLVGQIKDELAARTISDAALDQAISEEVTARENAVAAVEQSVTDLETIVTNNQAANEAAIESLEEAAEAAALTFDKARIVISNTDIANGYVDIAKKVLLNSINASVDRVMIHEVDDYTVTYNSASTRLTFVGDIIPSGDSPLESGDVLHVSFVYRASEN